ncbi:MAG: UDP-N-acetylglucosamine 2-epimerase (non-hydrolyzing) [Bacteroidota bacterium]
MKLLSVVGARPNFMKIAPFIRAISDYNQSANQKIEHILVHTGQHYDQNMSEAFFQELGIPRPDVNLGVGSGSHAEQVGITMIELEKVFRKEKPDWVIVLGDVNATLAASVTAKKEHIKCAHIEAGLRSGDIKMPEEVNRLVTDRLSDLLFTPDRLSNENLKSEGVLDEKIKFVGNIMIDTLEAKRKKAAEHSIEQIIKSNSIHRPSPNAQHPTPISYALMTMHRPSNVDDPDILSAIIDFLCDDVAAKMPLIWPIHPRTEARLKEFALWDKLTDNQNIIVLHPLGYLDMLRLNMDAGIMLTDSGGLQEECTVLGTPCITLRWNTERPVTLQEHGGASVLVGNDVSTARKEFRRMIQEKRKPAIPELWDGKTAGRILKEILSF